MEIGQKMQEDTRLRNYTQEQTAACLGISQVSYSRIENGQTKFDIQRMQQIAGVLEVDPVMLLSFDESFVFNNYSQPKGKMGRINYYDLLAGTDDCQFIDKQRTLSG